MAESYLLVSDLQIPYEAHKALEFCTYVKRHFKIKNEHCYCVGDEVDQLHGSMYPKDPEGTLTANGEIAIAREKLREWVNVFPEMKVAISNHGMRWIKKASAAEIPSQMIVAYQKVLELPESWRYRDEWIIRGSKKTFMMNHGLDLGGKTPYRQAAELGTISRAFGHLHSSPGICHVKTVEKDIWAMNTGCLIDVEAYAFKYEKNNRFKPGLGLGVVLDGGKLPVWLPYE